MKANIKITKEVDLRIVRVVLPVRYEDEQIPYDFPLRTGDTWKADIEIDTGKIIGWEKGKTGDMSLKVVDEGSYILIDSNDNEVLSITEGYVPNKLLPPTNGYGDYVKFIIDENGFITNWYKNPSVEQFYDDEE